MTTRHLRAFVCETCHSLVRNPADQCVLSLDSMDPGSSIRYRRITLKRVCVDCANAVYVRAETGGLL